MNNLKYFLQFVVIIILFCLFKILGHKTSSSISGKLFQFIGPLFRSQKLINKNIRRAFPKINKTKLKEISSGMWNNYGRIFSEYMFIKRFRLEEKNSIIEIKGQKILDKIKYSNKPVIFISGHFSNFELMAMHIEKSGIKLSAIYRPLNNKYLNQIMESIRKQFICKNQIKKGIGGIKELVRLHKKNYSTALMIDQRVSEGIKSNFFNEKALTTTIPAQLIKKFKTPLVPIFIERIDKVKFKITINKPIKFENSCSIQKITDDLNKILEKMILSKPNQWIWSHNRWK